MKSVPQIIRRDLDFNRIVLGQFIPYCLSEIDPPKMTYYADIVKTNPMWLTGNI
jgi:hypothetical protein